MWCVAKGKNGAPMNQHHRDLRIRTSLQRYVGDSPTDAEEIERLVRKARAAGVVVFTRKHLEDMAPFERVVVEGVHKRLCDRSAR